ncbi:hypothetical protein F4553_004533 [Allocatelliglobosispora scoriae]|uniref:Plasmid replication initiator protein n=1 Tax=Allocatelliglobosispora scoriae TaxID=643052 RepID=A0A841BSF0_9ACTN|nr:replication initiator [Allocatelliglobosispora scoriae]MBB5871154.1 hypothetical protein [Allocatelliglobosispora scoriae]
MTTALKTQPHPIDDAQRDLTRALLEGLSGLTLADNNPDTAALFDRASKPGFGRWFEHAGRARGCTQPVRLRGEVLTVEAGTGRLLERFTTDDLPDGVLYKPCGTRLSSRCPSCAEVYRWDCYQLIKSGLAGGKGVPESVATHPAVFVTLTAPSFGKVHAQLFTNAGKPKPCQARSNRPKCEHGKPAYCMAHHGDDDRRIGQPLCLECYDYPGHVMFNYLSARLWDRTMLRIRRALGAAGNSPLRLRYVKVAEFQRRGVVHLHALLRLDGYDPDRPDAILPPPVGVDPDGNTVQLYTSHGLKRVVDDAVAGAFLRTEPDLIQPAGWRLAWGGHNKTIPITSGLPGGEMTERHVAGYLAKYATKSTETCGVVAGRIDGETIDAYTNLGRHVHRLISMCWSMGADPQWSGMRRSAHKFGFGGHFHTKSRKYSTTMAALRKARRPGNRPRLTSVGDVDPVLTAEQLRDDAEATLAVATWQHVGNGWRTTADAALAAMAADAARQRRPQVNRPDIG